jgi:DnaJ family protein C protein 17
LAFLSNDIQFPPQSKKIKKVWMDDFDYYEILGLSIEADEKQIAKAYKLMALKYHPDKNPDMADDSKFIQIKVAYEFLSDPIKRKEYDSRIKIKLERKRWEEKLDSKRKVMKDELLHREAGYKKQKAAAEIEKLQKEARINELRKEAYERTKEEEEKIIKSFKQSIEKQNESKLNSIDEIDKSVKARWKKSKEFTETELCDLFKSFGEIDHLISKKAGSALIMYKQVESAHQAVLKSGIDKLKDITVSWAKGEPPSVIKELSKPVSQEPKSNMEDYESLTMMRLRQMQERKRLIEELEKEK